MGAGSNKEGGASYHEGAGGAGGAGGPVIAGGSSPDAVSAGAKGAGTVVVSSEAQSANIVPVRRTSLLSTLCYCYQRQQSTIKPYSAAPQDLATLVLQLQQQLAQKESKMKSLQSSVEQLSQQMAEKDRRLGAAQKAQAEAEAKARAAESQFPRLTGDKAKIQQQIAELQAQVEHLKAMVQELNEKLRRTEAERDAALQQRDANLTALQRTEATLAEVNAKLAELQQEKARLEATNAGLQERLDRGIAELRIQITELEAERTALHTNVADANKRIARLEGELRAKDELLWWVAIHREFELFDADRDQYVGLCVRLGASAQSSQHSVFRQLWNSNGGDDSDMFPGKKDKDAQAAPVYNRVVAPRLRNPVEFLAMDAKFRGKAMTHAERKHRTKFFRLYDIQAEKWPHKQDCPLPLIKLMEAKVFTAVILVVALIPYSPKASASASASSLATPSPSPASPSPPASPTSPRQPSFGPDSAAAAAAPTPPKGEEKEGKSDFKGGLDPKAVSAALSVKGVDVESYIVKHVLSTALRQIDWLIGLLKESSIKPPAIIFVNAREDIKQHFGLSDEVAGEFDSIVRDQLEGPFRKAKYKHVMTRDLRTSGRLETGALYDSWYQLATEKSLKKSGYGVRKAYDVAD